MYIQNIVSTSFTYFSNQILYTLTPLQKKVALIATVALSVLTFALLAYRYYFTKREEDQDLERDSTSLPSIRDNGHTYLYLKEKDVEQGGFIKDEIYREAVKNLTIVCVDTFLFNPTDKTYLLVLRKDPPAKGVWWLPGGRKKKGEFALDASVRLCKREVGLDVTAKKVLTVIETIFPDSMWGCQTDTVNFLVFATVNEQSKPVMDQTCTDYKWIPINDAPKDQDPYVQKAYHLALQAIKAEKW